jgi:hypothetical protein
MDPPLAQVFLLKAWEDRNQAARPRQQGQEYPVSSPSISVAAGKQSKAAQTRQTHHRTQGMFSCHTYL